ncbi:hypothetical protein HYR99_26745 [Candidatus Poribacteria bacterium]|nr:hypothetical protein [Candidatus Poribacteria bacterium]
MKKHTSILMFLFPRLRPICCWGLVVGLTFAVRAAVGELTPITLKHDNLVYSVAFSPDGTRLATGSADSTAKVWEMPSGVLMATLQHGDVVSSVAFSPDGTLLATGSWDRTAKVWEMPSGVLLATLQHGGWVWSVAFSPDGTLLATGAKVWAPNTADIPILTQPPDGSQFVDALPELKWGKLPNAMYQVQVAKDKNFSQMAVEVSIGAESLKVAIGQLAPGAYFWRVRTVGWDPSRDFGNWSEPWSFTVDFSQNIIIAPIIKVTQTEVTFEVRVEKAQNLYNFQFDLEFNPRVLETVNVTEGGFLKGKGGNTSFLKPAIDNNAGVIKNVVVSRVGPGEVDGAGTLVTLQVRFKQAGASPIRFTRVKLSNEGFQPIPLAYVDGSITLDVSASARFTVQPRIVNNQVEAKVLIADAVNLRGYTVDVEYPPASTKILQAIPVPIPMSRGISWSIFLTWLRWRPTSEMNTARNRSRPPPPRWS